MAIVHSGRFTECTSFSCSFGEPAKQTGSLHRGKVTPGFKLRLSLRVLCVCCSLLWAFLCGYAVLRCKLGERQLLLWNKSYFITYNFWLLSGIVWLRDRSAFLRMKRIHREDVEYPLITKFSSLPGEKWFEGNVFVLYTVLAFEK